MINISEVKIKYETLDNLMSDIINNIIYGNTVNIIVDMKDILSKFFQIELEIENEKLFVEELSSDVLSVISHYRWYFYKNNKYTNFYILWPYKVSNYYRNIDDKYNRHFEEKYLLGKYSRYIYSAIKTIESICSYIPHCVFVNSSEYDNWPYIYHICNSSSDYTLNVVLGTNKINLSCLNKHSFMLNINGDESILYSASNAVQLLTNNKYCFSNKLLPILLSFIGSKRNNIDSVKRVGILTAAKIINDGLNKLEISDTLYYTFPESLVNDVVLENKDLLNNNYKLVFPISLYISNQFNIQRELIEPKKFVTTEDFYDLNDDVFTNYNISVEGLLAGELTIKK